MKKFQRPTHSSPRTFLLLIFLIFFISSAMADDQSNASIEATFLKEIPHFVEDLSKAKTIRGDLDLYLAKNESEGIAIKLTSSKGQSVQISMTCSEKNSLIFEIFEIKAVPLANDSIRWVYDPLVPIAKPLQISANNPLLLYLKITATKESNSSRFPCKVNIYPETGKGVDMQFAVNVKDILLPDEMPVTVQAAIWPQKKWFIKKYGDQVGLAKTEENVVEMMRLLKKYRINAVSRLWAAKDDSAGRWPKEDVKTFLRLVDVALNKMDFKLLRLPTYTLFTNQQTFKERYEFSKNDVAQWIQETGQLLKQFDVMLTDPRWKGRFVYEIWDEPIEDKYPQVNELFKAFRQRSRLSFFSLLGNPTVQMIKKILQIYGLLTSLI